MHNFMNDKQSSSVEICGTFKATNDNYKDNHISFDTNAW